MKCTDKEWQTCRVEKMGCEGCYYDDSKIQKALITLDATIDCLDNSIKLANYDKEYAEKIDLEDFIEEKQAIETVIAELEKKERRIKDLEQMLNAKEILSASMPKDTDFIIMRKVDYDRNFKNKENINYRGLDKIAEEICRDQTNEERRN